MNPKLGDYIRDNRERYTRKAIRKQLIAAGHDPAVVDAELERVAGQSAAPIRPAGWRPRWREFFVLVLLGTIGALLVWADEPPYRAGGFAAVIYAIVVSIGFALGKAFSLMVDADNTVTPAILLALVAVGGAFVAVTSAEPMVAVAVAVLAGVPALLLIYLRGSNPRAAGMVGAGIPVLVWLAITGTCYSPLLGRLQGG